VEKKRATSPQGRVKKEGTFTKALLLALQLEKEQLQSRQNSLRADITKTKGKRDISA